MALQKRSIVLSILSVMLFGSVFLSGCRTAREKARQERRPENTVYEVPDQIPDLPEGQDATFSLWNQTEAQSVHLLQLSAEAALEKRYHAEHDVTILCLSGNAIVEVEGERHFVQPPAAVVIRRLWSYRIISHRSEEDFVALLIYSPPFEGEDAVLMGN